MNKVLGRAPLVAAIWLAVTFIIGSGVVCAQENEDNQVVLKSWNLCEYKSDLDGQWQGIIAASDGNCYFASSSHSNRNAAMFFKFDPATEEISVLIEDMSRQVGEDPTEVTAQGKIHSAVVESNGWLYFGTHMATFKNIYPGAHLIGFELETGEIRDFGVMEPGYSNYAGVAADSKNNAVFIYVVWPGQRNDKPCYLFRVDVETGEKRKVGELPPGGWDAAVYFMYVDDNGNCWLPAPDGVLAKYDSERDEMVMIPNALPEKSNMRYRQWYWSKSIPGQNKALVATYNSLYVFDPEADDQDKFRLVITGIGHVGLGADFNGETLYYTQSTGGRRAPVHLKSIDVWADEPEVVDHGLVVDQDGRRPWRLPSLAADAEGRVYITGDWYTLPGDTQTTRWNPENNGYSGTGRAQRFSFIRIPEENQ